MSKKVIKAGTKGLTQFIEGGANTLPSEAEFNLESSFVNSVLVVEPLTTGTVESHSMTFTGNTGRALVILPAAPTHGQQVRVFSVGGPSSTIGVSASHNFNGTSIKGYNLSSVTGIVDATFTYISSGGSQLWAFGPTAVTTGSYNY